MSDWTVLIDAYAGLLEKIADDEIQAFADAVVYGNSEKLGVFLSRLTTDELLSLQRQLNINAAAIGEQYEQAQAVTNEIARWLIITALMSLKEQVKEI